MNQITCANCGACCIAEGAPPFSGQGELNTLPADVCASYDEGIAQHIRNGCWEEPCFWLTPESRCEFYDYRPRICREYEVGGIACLGSRDEFSIEASERKGD